MGSFEHIMEQDFHDGQVLRELVLSITSIEKLAKKIGKHRNTLGGWFNKSRVDNDDLIEIGKALRYDMTTKFPRLKKAAGSEDLHFFNEDPSKFLGDLKRIEELMESKDQTLADAQLEIKMLQEKIGDLQDIIRDKNDLLSSKDQIIDMLQSQVELMKQGKGVG